MSIKQMEDKISTVLKGCFARETECVEEVAMLRRKHSSDPRLRPILQHSLSIRQWAIIFWRNVRNCKIHLVRKNLEMMKTVRNELAEVIFDASEQVPDTIYKHTLEYAEKIYKACHGLLPVLDLVYSNGIRWKPEINVTYQ